VNAGDDYDGTVARELAEELGVEAPCTAVDSLPAGPQTGWEFVRLYRAAHEGPFRMAPAEIDSGGFFTLDQIDRWTRLRPEDFAPGFLECYRLFRAAT